MTSAKIPSSAGVCMQGEEVRVVFFVETSTLKRRMRWILDRMGEGKERRRIFWGGGGDGSLRAQGGQRETSEIFAAGDVQMSQVRAYAF